MLLAPLLLAATPRALIVGGGPSRKYNQAAIESNVRYVAKALPAGTPYRVLFADGDASTASVVYSPKGGGRDRYRPPQLPRLDGPARNADVKREVAALTLSNSPVLLYFTGHGSLADDYDEDVSQFDLWRNDRITAPDLARSVAAFSRTTPVVLLMVQCHAGGFAKLLFAGGDPKLPPLDNRFCGFYASIEARMAAGCTTEIDEEYYRDFTTYFVAALSGRDRLGRPSTGADYDKDGRVGMNEAFCWSMVHDDSIDTPVCTSDEFLRTVVKLPDTTVFAHPFSTILGWASPAQKAAMEGLSTLLKLKGDDRLVGAYKKYSGIEEDDESVEIVRGFRLLRLAKSVVLGHAMASNPSPALRRRYETLLKDEAANPFKP